MLGTHSGCNHQATRLIGCGLCGRVHSVEILPPYTGTGPLSVKAPIRPLSSVHNRRSLGSRRPNRRMKERTCCCRQRRGMQSGRCEIPRPTLPSGRRGTLLPCGLICSSCAPARRARRVRAFRTRFSRLFWRHAQCGHAGRSSATLQDRVSSSCEETLPTSAFGLFIAVLSSDSVSGLK